MRPFFLHGPDQARLFAMHWAPRTGEPEPGVGSQAVLMLPPFAEEMNKCRPMLAAQARALADAGLHVLLVDLYGTGDSDGDFAEAHCSRWLHDLRCAKAWLQSEIAAACVHLLAVRAGALLVPGLLDEPGTDARLVLWQPLLKGADVWRQLLRTRLMADGARGEAVNSGELEERLARDGSIEIAGYTIAARLAAELGLAQLDEATVQRASRVLWLEVAAGDPPTLSTAGTRVCRQWQQGGLSLTSAAVPGEPFWSTPEIGWARALLGPTTAFTQHGVL
jgi:exosortase A-associated hydrolase 2